MTPGFTIQDTPEQPLLRVAEHAQEAPPTPLTVPEPLGLQAAGKDLWAAVAGEFELRDDERMSLESACRTLDELRLLEAALADASPIVRGSKGQERPNPLFAEVRAHRLTLRQLLHNVGLTDADDAQGQLFGQNRSGAGRALARQRWNPTRG